METLRLIFLIVHILGFAALIGGLLAQAGPGEKRVTGVMRDGVGTAFLAGLALVGVLEAGDDPVNHAKVGVKLVIGLVLLVLVMANLRKTRIPQGLWAGLLALAVLEVVIAVAWSPVHAS
jgi:peptidoglycan/LPS O-acetylase OafA/YrhL